MARSWRLTGKTPSPRWAIFAGMTSEPISSLVCPKWTDLGRRERSPGEYGPSHRPTGRKSHHGDALPASDDPCAPPRAASARRCPRRGSTHAGQLLSGRYRLIELVARGATGRVWRAHDEVLTRQVAVKQLVHQHSRGLAEARIAARVRHPNVAAVHDAIEHDGFDWLVMDYHGGGTLDDLLGRRRRLPPPVVAALGLQLLAALTAVHDAGVVHCDVKPANLLLGEDGRLVLRLRHRRDRRQRPPRPGER